MRGILIYFAIVSLIFALEPPQQHQPSFPECGVPLLPPPSLDRARPPRPTLSGAVSFRVKTHVRVHYTTSGSDATTWQYAESVAVYAETSWVRVTAMGWDTPPPDQGVGGDDLYDIYIRAQANIYGNAYGVCWWDSAYTTPYVDGYSSWVEVTKDSVAQPFARYPRLRALVAHEFHHGCQMRHSCFEEPLWWFYENTSVCMEDYIYDDVNTLYYRLNNYEPNPLRDPECAVNDTSGGYEYPGALWAHFLNEYFGSAAVRRIWERCGNNAGNHILSDINWTLSTYYGSDFNKAQCHYAIWRWFCGDRDIGLHFEEGPNYRNASTVRSHSTYPANGNEGLRDPSGPGGCGFIRLSDFGSNRVLIFFDGQNGYVWAAYVLGINNNGTYHEYKIMLESTQDTGSVSIPGWEYDTLVIMPVVTHWSGAAIDLSYNYSVELVTLTSVDELASAAPAPGLHVVSSPTKAPIEIMYALPDDCREASMSVFDVTGRLITLFILNSERSNGSVLWSGRDLNGQRAPRGVYFIQLCVDKQTIGEKLILAR